jgi:type II secretory pathway pseudopilin PulG
MLKTLKNRELGDTIIEVLFAVTVFSLVAVGGLSIMNQGITTSQRALEITLVRQEIDAQAESLRFLHDAYIAAYHANGDYEGTPAQQWALMVASIVDTDTFTLTNLSNVSTCPVPSSGAFIINTRTAKFVAPSTDKLQDAQTYSRVEYESTDSNAAVKSADGIWIEAVRSGDSGDANQSNSGYIDFNILACWNGPGLSVPVTIGTVVRLYEPRG